MKKKKKNSRTSKFNNYYAAIVMTVIVVGGIASKIERSEQEREFFKETAVTTCKITMTSRTSRFRKIDYYYIVDSVTYKFANETPGRKCHVGEFYLVKYSLKDHSFHEILWDKGKQPRPEGMTSIRAR